MQKADSSFKQETMHNNDQAGSKWIWKRWL